MAVITPHDSAAPWRTILLAMQPPLQCADVAPWRERSDEQAERAGDPTLQESAPVALHRQGALASQVAPPPASDVVFYCGPFTCVTGRGFYAASSLISRHSDAPEAHTRWWRRRFMWEGRHGKRAGSGLVSSVTAAVHFCPRRSCCT